MAILDAKTLSLADLEAFDPQAPDRGTNRRFLCPLAGCDGHSPTASHRNLSANVTNGAWNCKRCKEYGLLLEFREARPKPNPRDRARPRGPHPVERKLVPAAAPLVIDPAETWRKKLQQPGYLLPLEGTPAEGYLLARGIPADLARAAKVRYCPRWEHWEQDGKQWALKGASRRVVFPIYADDRKTLAAVQARSISREDDYDAAKLSRGQVAAGVFATPGAWEAETVALVEAPIDALSLAACGLPAIATMGCNLPAWIWQAMHRKRALIGTDADEAGDTAAAEWKGPLEAYGAHTKRLRPEGAKDWNEALCRDPDGLRAFLAPYVVAPGPPLVAAPTEPQATPPTDSLGELFSATVLEACGLLAGASAEAWEPLEPLEAEMNEALAADDLPRLSVACSAYLDTAREVHARGIPDPFDDEPEELPHRSLFDIAPPAAPSAYGGLQHS